MPHTLDPPPDDDPPAPPPIAPPLPKLKLPHAVSHAPVRPAHNETFLSRWGNGRGQAAVFVAAFVAIGSYAVLHSYAASITNDINVLRAVQRLGQVRSAKVQTTAKLTYKDSAFKSASLTAATSIGRDGANRSLGSLTVVRQAGDSLRQTVFPFDIRGKYGGHFFKIGNTGKLGELFAADSGPAGFIKDRQAAIARLNGQWYSFSPADQFDDNDPELRGLGCLVDTPLIPNHSQWRSIGRSYSRYFPLRVTKHGEVYNLKLRSARNVRLFLSAVGGQTYGQKLNSCVNANFHTNFTDWLAGLAANNSLSADVTIHAGQITKIAVTTNGPKAGLQWTSTIAYNQRAVVNTPGVTDIYNANGLPRLIANPNAATQLSLLNYNLPPGWTADYCGYDKDTVSVELYDSPPAASVPYCSGKPLATLGAFQFDFEGDDFYSPYMTGSYGSFINAIDDSAAHDALAKENKDPASEDCDYTEIKKTSLIDSHRVARVEHDNTSACFNIPSGTKYIQYLYQHSTGGKFHSFYASYTQEPSKPDYLPVFDSMIQSTHFNW